MGDGSRAAVYRKSSNEENVRAVAGFDRSSVDGSTFNFTKVFLVNRE